MSSHACRSLVLLLTVAGSFSIRAASADPGRSGPARPPEPKLESVFLELTGLDEAKGATVEKAVLSVKGVRSWTWVTRTTDVKIVREVGLAADASLATAATGAGATTAGVIPIAVETLTFSEPLHCAGCIKTVVKALRALPAVKEVFVPETMATVAIFYDTRSGKVAEFEKALADAGKPATRGGAGPSR